jgi:hypothetical protein
MATLRIYISSSCIISRFTQDIIQAVQRLRPWQEIEVINLDVSESSRPHYVFGTPTYCLDDEIIALGNPTVEDLIALLDSRSV